MDKLAHGETSKSLEISLFQEDEVESNKISQPSLKEETQEQVEELPTGESKIENQDNIQEEECQTTFIGEENKEIFCHNVNDSQNNTDPFLDDPEIEGTSHEISIRKSEPAKAQAFSNEPVFDNQKIVVSKKTPQKVKLIRSPVRSVETVCQKQTEMRCDLDTDKKSETNREGMTQQGSTLEQKLCSDVIKEADVPLPEITLTDTVSNEDSIEIQNTDNESNSSAHCESIQSLQNEIVLDVGKSSESSTQDQSSVYIPAQQSSTEFDGKEAFSEPDASKLEASCISSTENVPSHYQLLESPTSKELLEVEEPDTNENTTLEEHSKFSTNLNTNESIPIPIPLEELVANAEDSATEHPSESLAIESEEGSSSVISEAQTAEGNYGVSSSLLKIIEPHLKTTLMVDVSGEKVDDDTEAITSATEEAREDDIKTSSDTSKNLLKITITKQSDSTHSILKICSPKEKSESVEMESQQHEKPSSSLHTKSSQKLSPVKTGTDIPESSVSSDSAIEQFSTVSSPVYSDQLITSNVGSSIPTVTIKNVTKPDTTSLKLTIKPVWSDDSRETKSRLSVKPIAKSCEVLEPEHARVSPKIIIKPLIKPEEVNQEKESHKHKSSPKLTIKPIVKPDEESIATEEYTQQKSSPKLIIKPIVKPEDTNLLPEEYKVHKVCPKLTIKPIMKPDDLSEVEQTVHSPRITIKPIVKPEEQRHSPKIIIKPIVKSEDYVESYSPRVIIKPIEDHDEKLGRSTKYSDLHSSEAAFTDKVCDPPKITIKPVLKPVEAVELVDFEDQIKQERIILKINKSTLPVRKRDHPEDSDKSGKLAKIKVKYSKEGGHARIVHQQPVSGGVQRSFPEDEIAFRKRFKLDDLNIPQGKNALNILMQV